MFYYKHVRDDVKNLASYTKTGTLPTSKTVRIVLLLGLKPSADFDELWLADIVAQGLPTKSAESVQALLKKANIDTQFVSETSLRRLRKNRHKLSKLVSGQLYRFCCVLDALAFVFGGNIDQIGCFLNSPHQLLDGRKPIEVVSSSSAGTDVVLNLINRAQLSFVV